MTVAFAGQEIDNPSMGARIRFLQVAADTNGELLDFEFVLKPGGVIAVAHVHPRQEERFEVLEGAVEGHVGGVARRVERGGTNVVRPGVSHAWRGAGPTPTRLRVQFRPALETEQFFDVVFALARAGRTDSRGVPRLLPRLAVMAAFPDEFRPAGLPIPLHRFLVWAFAPFGRRLRRSFTVSAAAAPRPT